MSIIFEHPHYEMVKWSAADNWATGRKNGMIRMRGAAEREIIIMKYAIIFSNLLVPLIEKVTVPKSFGKKKPEKEAA